jgi:hypothetical protein
MSFLAFIVVALFLLMVVTVYLHIFLGYWLDCERERQAINQSLVGTNELPIESIPTLFSFPDAVSRMLTSFAQFIAICSWLQLVYMCTSRP